MGLRKWLDRPMRGRHLGVSDLTTGDDGVPVCLICSNTVLLSLPFRPTHTNNLSGLSPPQMGSSNHRLCALSSLGRRSCRYWIPHRLLRPLRPQRRNPHDRVRLLAWKPG
jgi:hypothetical protein